MHYIFAYAFPYCPLRENQFHHGFPPTDKASSVHRMFKCNSLSSQDSNSLSLLTEISGVEAPVPLWLVPVLESLASGLPRRRGDGGSRCG